MLSASPETIRREPLEFDLLRSVGHLQDLAACALWNPVIFFSPEGGGLSRRCRVPFCRHEVSFSAIHGNQIRDHLPGHGQGCSVSVPLLLLSFVDQG